MSGLSNLKKTIEGMAKCHHIEILSMLNKCPSITINENNNGTFINLSELDSKIIEEIQQYVVYVEKQQKQLLIIEEEKLQLEEKFFNKSKHIKENNLIVDNDN